MGACVNKFQMKETETEIDLSNLSPGVYFIGIGNERVKIVKQ